MTQADHAAQTNYVVSDEADKYSYMIFYTFVDLNGVQRFSMTAMGSERLIDHADVMMQITANLGNSKVRDVTVLNFLLMEERDENDPNATFNYHVTYTYIDSEGQRRYNSMSDPRLEPLAMRHDVDLILGGLRTFYDDAMLTGITLLSKKHHVYTC